MLPFSVTSCTWRAINKRSPCTAKYLIPYKKWGLILVRRHGVAFINRQRRYAAAMLSVHMKISLLGIGSETLLSELDSAGIKYSHRPPPLGAPVASGNTIEITTLIKDAVPWAAIASVLVAWLRSRSSRKVILTLDDNKVFHAEGMSVDEIQRLLSHTKKVAACETKKPEKPNK